jgi:chlorobactene glucosyltransferase
MPVIYLMIYLALGIFLVITLINILSGPFLKKAQPLKNRPMVSVLIPARNEEVNIGACLKSLLRQDYPNFEILVLDDESTDQTAQIVEKYMKSYSKIHLQPGKPLPEGWTGKNWACHQLSQLAHGDILIFTDADNTFWEKAVSRTVGWMQTYQTGLLSAFPQQITGTFFEKLIVPAIDLLLYTSLVLWLTYYSRYSSLAAANGQWIAFTRKNYTKTGGHQEIRQKIVEDVELSRVAKKKGISILTLAGTGLVYGHMYHSAMEVRKGFSKNLFGLVSNQTIPFFLILIGLSFTYILPYFLIFSGDPLIFPVSAVILNILLRLLLAIRYKHSVLISTILHPISVLLIILIGLNSFYNTKLGSLTWKGREISLKS